MLVWKAHKAKVRALAFAPGGGALASIAGDSRFVWLWEAHTGKLLRKVSGSYYAVRAVTFTPDGRYLIALHERNRVCVLEVDTGALVAALTTPMWMYPDWVALAPDASRLIANTGHQFVTWDEPTRPAQEPREPDRDFGPRAALFYPLVFGFSPLGTWFWQNPSALAFFDPVRPETELFRLTDPNSATPTAVAFTPDESRVCAALGHRAIVWRLGDRAAPPLHLRGHGQQVRAVGFPPGGGTVLTAAMDGTVRIWDVNTGAEVRAFEWGIGKIRAAVVSPDGALCAAGSDSGHLVVWDADN